MADLLRPSGGSQAPQTVGPFIILAIQEKRYSGSQGSYYRVTEPRLRVCRYKLQLGNASEERRFPPPYSDRVTKLTGQMKSLLLHVVSTMLTMLGNGTPDDSRRPVSGAITFRRVAVEERPRDCSDAFDALTATGHLSPRDASIRGEYDLRDRKSVV